MPHFGVSLATINGKVEGSKHLEGVFVRNDATCSRRQRIDATIDMPLTWV